MSGPNSILDLPKLETRLLGMMAAIAVALFVALILNIVMSTGRIWGDFPQLWAVADMPAQIAGSLPYDAERYSGLVNERFSINKMNHPWPTQDYLT